MSLRIHLLSQGRRIRVPDWQEMSQGKTQCFDCFAPFQAHFFVRAGLQVWCEVEKSSKILATREQAGLEAVEQLQNAWRRLKRDEKVSSGSRLRPGVSA